MPQLRLTAPLSVRMFFAQRTLPVAESTARNSPSGAKHVNAPRVVGGR